MINYPKSFGVISPDLSRQDIGPVGNTAIKELAEQNLHVQLGFNGHDLGSIQNIAGSVAIMEFCPNDIKSRFSSQSAAQNWLRDGKGLFELRDNTDNTLAGYGWTGPKTNQRIPKSDTTFAVRLSPEYSGRHLGSAFTRAIVAGSLATFGQRDIWLETWASNTAAVKTYLGVDARLITVANAKRPTLQSENRAERDDTRLFMRFITSKYLLYT